jgi:nucleotide-binding universal stress UspA family protein
VNIVVGYTPTPEGLAAVDYAVGAVTPADRLVVVNTGERGNDATPAFAEAADWDALDQKLTDLAIDHQMHQPELVQSTADEIIRVATAVEAGLIVIGLRRRSPVGKLFLGSISQQVILEAECPVVAVKRPA